MKINSFLILITVTTLISLGLFFYQKSSYYSSLFYWGNDSQQTGLWLKPGNYNVEKFYVDRSFNGDLISLTENTDGYSVYFRERKEPFNSRKLDLGKNMQIYLFEQIGQNIEQRRIFNVNNLPKGEYILSLNVGDDYSTLTLKLK